MAQIKSLTRQFLAAIDDSLPMSVIDTVSILFMVSSYLSIIDIFGLELELPLPRVVVGYVEEDEI